MRRHALLCAIAASALAAVIPARSLAQPQAKTADSTISRGKIDGEAVRNLNEMAIYLRSLKTFEVRSKAIAEDVIDDSGAKVTTAAEVTYRVRRPDGFYVEVAGERQVRQFWYDGRSFTVYAPNRKYYARFDAPPTIGATLDRAYSRYGISLPLADLFDWGVADLPPEALTMAARVGHTVTINGVNTDHFIFAGADLVWQIWIEQGDRPLPRRIVITTVDDPGKPSYTADLTWNIAPAPFAADAFTFRPPAEVKPIALAAIGE